MEAASSGSRDELLRSVIDRARASLGGHVEAELGATVSEILRLAAEERSRIAEDARQAHDVLARQLEDARRDLDVATRDADEVRRAGDEVRRELAQACAARDEARRDCDDALRERDDVSRQLDATDALPASLRTLDEAGTLGAVLDGLLCLAFAETGRAVVFLVKGDRLESFRAQGLSSDDQARTIDLGPEVPSVLAEAVRSGVGCEHRDGDGWPLPSFAMGEGARQAVAYPVAVGGSVIAVLYADALLSETVERPRWPGVLDVTARYAGRVLEGLTVRQAAALWGARPARAGRSAPERAHARTT
jgi:hypothetical protein